MNPASRALYVSRSNEQAFAPPYSQEGCRLYGFWLPCDPARLQKVCDRFLNQPSQGALRIEVAAPYILLYFCSFARSRSLHADDIERGWLGENECALLLVVKEARPTATPALALFPFAMFVDSGPAAISGRELLGFPKEIGHISLPSSTQDPVLLALDALVFPSRGREVAGRWSRLIEVARIPDGSARAYKTPLSEMRSFGTSLLRTLRRTPLGIPFLLLKQIRDAEAPERACHQSVLLCRPRLHGLRSLRRLPGCYEIRIRHTESHPIVSELGIEQAALGMVRGFQLEMDFTLQAPSLLWKAT